jgi:hypothetical protein
MERMLHMKSVISNDSTRHFIKVFVPTGASLWLRQRTGYSFYSNDFSADIHGNETCMTSLPQLTVSPFAYRQVIIFSLNPFYAGIYVNERKKVKVKVKVKFFCA